MMRITEGQLRRIVREELTKKSRRKEIQEASDRDAIVYLGDGVTSLTAIAYDIHDLDNVLNIAKVDYNGVIAGVKMIPSGEWGNCNGSWHVEKSARSRAGWGTKTYLAAIAGVGQLSPDRASISKEAEKAWRRIANEYKPLTKPFDDKFNPVTPPKEDDCEIYHDPILDASYELPNGPPADVQAMIARGADHFKDITARGERKAAMARLKDGFDLLFSIEYYGT